MATNNEDENHSSLWARVDERTKSFAEGLTELRRTTEEQTKTLLAALDRHATDDTTRFAKADDTFDKHDGRLKMLENWRWWLVGAIAALGTILWFLKEI